jgi:glycopeptide antibiotics resistance protein
MADRRPFRRGRFAGWAIAYALAIAYVSLVLGPAGVNFVPLDPEVAWRKLLATPYLTTDSGQRPDWVANLLMLVPLGFGVTGMFWPRRRRLRWLAAGAALCCCLFLVIAVKYLQLFFPPRTVSLNYIEAQSLGSLLGVVLFWMSSDRLFSVLRDISRRGRRALLIACAIYTVALLVFFLFPFDFVLSAEDFRERVAALPHMLLSWTGEGLSTPLRVLIVLAGTAATVPLGVMLALMSRRRSLFRITVAGFVMICVVTVLTMFVLTATPSLMAVFYRTVGIVIGAAMLMWFEGQDPVRWRNQLTRLVPLMILPYVLAVAFVNDLLSPHWRTVPEALAALDKFGLLPFYHHYIVSKAHAAESVAVHLLIFAPIGVMVALRRGSGPAEVWTAAILAALLSLAVEIGRWLKPGLQPDFSDVIIAAAAAGIAAKLTPGFWSILEGETFPQSTAPAPKPVRSPAIAPRQSADPQSREDDLRRPATIFARFVTTAVCLALAAAIAVNYPLAPWVLGIALLIYAAVLWRWPALWLAVIPAVLPAVDLTPWTGWMHVGEPDLFVLVTIGILALRAPPGRTDFRLEGIPAAALVLSLISYCLSVALGLALPGPEGGSDNAYLRPDNALRLAKGFFTALALLPFLRARMRTHGDAIVWLGTGMAAGLALVAAATLAERAAFTGLFDFTSDYRVVATFSSMHVGGGHIGAYIAMALPFLLVCLLRPRPLTLLAMFGIAIGAGYALVVSYARAAYAAALVSMLTAGLGWAWAARHRHTGRASTLALSALLLLTIGGIVVAAVGSGFMAERLRTVVPDLADREGNWRGGLALRDDNPATALFGMGLGTYPRIVLARRSDERFPTNFVVAQDGGYRFLSLHAGLPTYFGQKVPVRPDRQYRVFAALRSPDGKGVLSVILCEKMLLYSANCRDTTFRSHLPRTWESFGAAISSVGLDEDATLGWFKRPVELALFDPVPGSTIEIGHIRMLDPQGRDILANGDFSRGTERWYFTDDQHLIWRIKNQYLMSLFESGALGLASFILLAATALAGAARAMGRGDRMAAAVAASVVAFVCSGVFDYLLGVPRLAALFYLVAFCGLTMMQAPMRGPTVSAISPDRSTSRSDRPARPD